MDPADPTCENAFRQWTRQILLYTVSTAVCAIALSWVAYIELAVILASMMKYADLPEKDQRGWVQLGYFTVVLVAMLLPLPVFLWIWNLSNTLFNENRLGDSVTVLIVVAAPSLVVRTLVTALGHGFVYGFAAGAAYLAYWVAKKGVEWYYGEGEETRREDFSNRYRCDPDIEDDDDDDCFEEPNGKIEFAPLIPR